MYMWLSFTVATTAKSDVTSAVRGTMSARSSISIRPFGDPPNVISKKTTGFSIVGLMVATTMMVNDCQRTPSVFFVFCVEDRQDTSRFLQRGNK